MLTRRAGVVATAVIATTAVAIVVGLATIGHSARVPANPMTGVFKTLAKARPDTVVGYSVQGRQVKAVALVWSSGETTFGGTAADIMPAVTRYYPWSETTKLSVAILGQQSVPVVLACTGAGCRPVRTQTVHKAGCADHIYQVHDTTCVVFTVKAKTIYMVYVVDGHANDPGDKTLATWRGLNKAYNYFDLRSPGCACGHAAGNEMVVPAA